MAQNRADEGQYGARRRALAAAREVLRDHGFGSFSVERVARVAGLSRRTLYNQFECRAELYRAVRLELFAEIEATLPREIGRSGSLREAIEQFVRESCFVLAGDVHVQLRAAVTRDGADLPWLPALYRERVIQPLEWAVERCLLQQAHGHALQIDEPAAHAQRLVAMVMVAVVEPAAFHPTEIAAIFLNRLSAPGLPFAPSGAGHLPIRPNA